MNREPEQVELRVMALISSLGLEKTIKLVDDLIEETAMMAAFLNGYTKKEQKESVPYLRVLLSSRDLKRLDSSSNLESDSTRAL